MVCHVECQMIPSIVGQLVQFFIGNDRNIRNVVHWHNLPNESTELIAFSVKIWDMFAKMKCLEGGPQNALFWIPKPQLEILSSDMLSKSQHHFVILCPFPGRKSMDSSGEFCWLAVQAGGLVMVSEETDLDVVKRRGRPRSLQIPGFGKCKAGFSHKHHEAWGPKPPTLGKKICFTSRSSGHPESSWRGQTLGVGKKQTPGHPAYNLVPISIDSHSIAISNRRWPLRQCIEMIEQEALLLGKRSIAVFCGYALGTLNGQCNQLTCL